MASTSYKGGQGDILAEISAACTKYDVDMGLYQSPWDIHDESYGYYDAEGNPTDAKQDVLDYNDYYVNQLMRSLEMINMAMTGILPRSGWTAQKEAAPMHRIMTSSAGMTPFRHRKVYKQVMTANA